MLLSATLIASDGAFKVQIKDISAKGARVLSKSLVTSSGDTIFRRGRVFVAAKISWSEREEMGLRFYRQLSESELGLVFQPVSATTSLP